MKPIVEYLLSKSNAKDKKENKDLILLFAEAFAESNEAATKMYNIVDEHMSKENFGTYRIISNYSKINNIINKDTKLLMTNLADHIGITEDLFTNIIDDMTGIDIKQFEGTNYDFDIYLADTFVMITDNDTHILIDTLPDNEDFDPEIKTYYCDHGEAIELSNRALANEFDDTKAGDSEYVWDTFNNMSERYCDDFREETGIELIIGGRNGKHVCARASYELIHNLNKYTSLVDEYQDNLINEINDWIKDNLNEEE